jgi:hypothetical protein
VYCVHISLIFHRIGNTQTTFPAAFCDSLCCDLTLQGVVNVIYEFEHVIEFGGKVKRWGRGDGRMLAELNCLRHKPEEPGLAR